MDHLGKGSYNFYCVGTTWVFVYRCRVLGVREGFIYGLLDAMMVLITLCPKFLAKGSTYLVSRV